MFEKVNPDHPDKIADRIAGAIVDLGYKKQDNPKIAAEVLIGHDECNIIIETDVDYQFHDIADIVDRIVGRQIKLNLKVVKQDINLSDNQKDEIRSGDNGIFKGVKTNEEEKTLSTIARAIYNVYSMHDGKYIIDKDRLIICQSNIRENALARYKKYLKEIYGFNDIIVNPLGYWTGGIDVDCGATNRKLGSDMGRAVTGGGLHGKDLSKGDVSINIYAHLKAKQLGQDVNISCAIGDKLIDGKPFEEIVKIAKEYIVKIGGFEKLAEWGLI